jgi:hypothetical protein
MNKKIIIIVTIVSLIALGSYFVFTKETNQSTTNITEESDKTSPNRPAEINGLIISALGNEIKIANEVDRVVLTEEEQAAKKAETQKLSPEERAAAREAEKADLKIEEISVTIPVGVPIIKGSGDASGSLVNADIADLSKGTYVSIWTDASGKIEHVKIKGS